MSFLSDLRQLLSFLLQWARSIPRARWTLALIILAGVVSGLSNAALIAVINSALTESRFSAQMILGAFIALCILLPLSRFASGALLLRLTAAAVYELRVRLSKRILSARQRTLEEQGPHRLLATLTEDVPAVTNALTDVPNLFMQLFIVLGCLFYLGWLSWLTLLVVAAFLVVGILTYQIPTRSGMRHLGGMRDAWDGLLKSFQGVIDGSKELKLHHGRRRAFFERKLQPAAASVQRHGVLGQTIFLGATSWGHVLFFVLVGVVLFVMPRVQTLEPEVLTGYTLAILYIMNPLNAILNSMPTLARATVSMRAIERMGLLLTERGVDAEVLAEAPPPWGPWDELHLDGVSHRYPSDTGDQDFILGPLDLTLERGELLFITGGNGSGKTTLAKLITGLYLPETGRIVLGGVPVDEERLEAYRQQFAVVFSEIFLFDELLGVDGADEAGQGLDERARGYLETLKLTHKVQVAGGALSTVDLSKGQRKRLALLTAYLEDRPFYLFDEWAADQDPEFKEVFYRQLLPELKARGKTVVVISHDDRYYEVADRVLHLEFGQVVREGRPGRRQGQLVGA